MGRQAGEQRPIRPTRPGVVLGALVALVVLVLEMHHAGRVEPSMAERSVERVGAAALDADADCR